MRAVRLRVSPGRGGFGPFHRATIEVGDITVEAVHELRLLADGTSVLLYEFTGDTTVAEQLAADHGGPADVDWQVTELDGRKLMYVHTDPSLLTQSVLELLDEWKVVVDWPIRIVRDTTLLVSLIGDEGEIRGLIEQVPEGVDVRVERTGDYLPESKEVLATLTPRERETLEVAHELGYYENPRGTRYEEIADAVDCTAGTVGHHLRNAESKLVAALLSEERVGAGDPVDT